ncbi:MAG: CPBP family intramembrane metalloprotease [Solobacterium sp.]|nr:CPBP family intramembrane metalloprotease [Solobacterium sp.]
MIDLGALYRKNELAFAILCIVIYVVAGANFRAEGDDSLVMLLGLLIIALVLYIFVRNAGLTEKYGLTKKIYNVKEMVWFLPVWIVSTGNLWGGIHLNYKMPGLLYAVVSFALVGFIEELLFRGFLFRAMLKDGNTVSAITISSITFGMGHIINLFTGHATFETFFQIVFAIAVGFLFTMVYYKCGNLWPLILSHSLIDMFSVFASDSVTADRMYIVSVIIIAAAYCIYLKKIPTPDVMTVPAEGQIEE